MPRWLVRRDRTKAHVQNDLFEKGFKAIQDDSRTFLRGLRSVVKQIGREMRLPHGAKPSRYKIIGRAAGAGSIGLIKESLRRGHKENLRRGRKKK